MSDAILTDCLSAAICRKATKLTNYWREGSISTAIQPASAYKVMGQHNKIGGITFGATTKAAFSPIATKLNT
jgi:hypothetical protein